MGTTKKEGWPRSTGRRYSLEFRLSVMDEATRVGVSGACLKFGISRTTCYAWGKRWNPSYPQSLANYPRKNVVHPFAISQNVTELILDISARNPTWGCKRLSAYITMLEMPVSSPTIQKVLMRAGRGRVKQRLEALAEGS